METADAWLRWTRAAALASVVVLVAVWAHVGADGRLPSAPVLVMVVIAATVAARPLLARPASAVRVVVLTVGGQATAHAVLSLTAGHHSPAGVRPTAPVTHSATHHHGAHAVSAEHADPVTHLLHDLASASTGMLVTHLAAAVVVGAWLAAGERAVWTLLTLAWRALTLLVPVVHTCPAPRVATPVARPSLLRRVTAGTVVRRGPPSLLAT